MIRSVAIKVFLVFPLPWACSLKKYLSKKSDATYCGTEYLGEFLCMMSGITPFHRRVDETIATVLRSSYLTVAKVVVFLAVLNLTCRGGYCEANQEGICLKCFWTLA